MNTRFLKQAFVLLLCSLFFAGTALWLVSVKEPRSYGGEPVFAKTLQNLDNLGRLTIETPKTGLLICSWKTTCGGSWKSAIITPVIGR